MAAYEEERLILGAAESLLDLGRILDRMAVDFLNYVAASDSGAGGDPNGAGKAGQMKLPVCDGFRVAEDAPAMCWVRAAGLHIFSRRTNQNSRRA